jgi:hypothetical protein
MSAWWEGASSILGLKRQNCQRSLESAEKRIEGNKWGPGISPAPCAAFSSQSAQVCLGDAPASNGFSLEDHPSIEVLRFAGP